MGPRSEMNCAGTTQTKELKVGGRKAGGPFWRVAEVVSQHGERTWGSFQRGRGWLGGGYSPDNIVRAWAPWRRKGWGFSYDPNVVQNRSFYQKYVVSHCSLDPSNAPLETLSPGLCSGIDVTADRGRGHRQGQADALASFGWSFLCTSWWLKMPTALIWFSSQSRRGFIGDTWSIWGILQAGVEPLQWDIQPRGRCHLCKGGLEQKAKRTPCWEVTKGHGGKKTAANGDEEGMKGLFVWRKSGRTESRKDIFSFHVRCTELLTSLCHVMENRLDLYEQLKIS